MTDRLSEIKNMVEAMEGDLTLQLFGYDMNAEAVVNDFKWLIEQAKKAEGLQKDVDFFIKRHEVNKLITQELVALNDPRVVEILTKTRSIG